MKQDQNAATERRANSRFAIQSELRYLLNNETLIASGNGHTLNLSSRGVLFTTEQRLTVGSTVELSIGWPAKLDEICPLHLVILGRVVRSDARTAACTIEEFEFRTSASAHGLVPSVRGSLEEHPQTPTSSQEAFCPAAPSNR
jgi:hypothetical protein